MGDACWHHLGKGWRVSQAGPSREKGKPCLGGCRAACRGLCHICIFSWRSHVIGWEVNSRALGGPLGRGPGGCGRVLNSALVLAWVPLPVCGSRANLGQAFGLVLYARIPRSECQLHSTSSILLWCMLGGSR